MAGASNKDSGQESLLLGRQRGGRWSEGRVGIELGQVFLGPESVAQLNRDSADCENGFDELKNQWVWAASPRGTSTGTRPRASRGADLQQRVVVVPQGCTSGRQA